MGYGAGWIGSSFGWLTNPQDASGGTVSSVGLSMPSAFTVTNSPVTTTGILTVTGSGTTSQFIDGTGALQLIPSLSGEQGYWGAFYDLSATQQALSTTVAYAINIGQSDPLNNGVSIVSGNRITFAYAGIYNIQYSIQFTNTDGQIHNVNVWLRKNGATSAFDVADSNSQYAIINSHGGIAGKMIAAINYVFSVEAGDYFYLMWQTENVSVYLETIAAGITPSIPVSPCVIFTAVSLPSQGLGYYGLTSSTSVLIGYGSKTFTTNRDANSTAFTVGTRVRVADTPVTNFMEGDITAFSGTTLTVLVDAIGGSGSPSFWTFSVAGIQGASGTISDLNGLISGTQTFATGTSGNDFNISSSGTIHTFNLPTASATNRGALSSADWSTFSGKQNALTIGNITDAGTDGITISGGTGAIIGSGVSISQQVSDATHNGYLSSTDWTTFNNKLNLSGGTMTGYLILNADPVSSLGATTKDYVDNLINGIDWKASANAGTVASLPSYVVSGSGQVLTGSVNGAIPSATTDGVTLVATNRVLVKNETLLLAPNNGIYTVTQAGNGSTKFILTRSSDANTSNLLSEATLSISGGSTLNNTQWHCNPASTPINIGVTDITFSQIGSGVYLGTAPINISGNTISIAQSNGSTNGYLSSTDWTTFNGKQNALTIGNITDVGTDGISVTGGTGAIIGSGVNIAQSVATSLANGYLSSTDWSTFNNKSRLQYNNSTATQAITAATITYLTGSNITTANIQAGTVVTWTVSVTKTAAGTAAPLFSVTFGTTSTTADAILLNFTGNAQTAIADTGEVTIRCTFRTVGSGTSAVLVGHYNLVHRLPTTGLSTGQGGVFTTSAGFNSTTASAFLGLTLNTGASSAWTVNQVNVKIENLL
jgi:hypothetical protein